MLDVFISYRRSDTRGDAGRLFDRLSGYFGSDHVFMDVDDIDPGQDFAVVLQKALARCGALIVLIGPGWVDVQREDGSRRLDDPADFVRVEIRAALGRGARVIPVLVGGAKLPQADQLPDDLAGLLRHQAFEITDPDFHADVDRLIAGVEDSVGFGWHRLGISRPLRQALLVLAAVALPVGLLLGAGALRTAMNERGQVRTHLDVGARFVLQGEYAAAAAEFEEALDVDPDNVPALRALISAKAQELNVDAFGPGSSLGVGIRPDYDRFKPVPDSAIDQVRSLVYRVQALEPALREEPDLMLDEALVLKTGGPRARDAIPLLERARELAPTNARVASELGLLKAVILDDPRGVESVRSGLEIEPEEARYHYYLGRSLETTARCSFGSPEPPGPPESAGTDCAEALRAYRNAMALSGVDEVGPWEIGSLAASGSWGILHAYARRGLEDPIDTLAMSVDERIEELVTLLDRGPERSASGWWDRPALWLATLYEARGDFEAAAGRMEELVDDGPLASQPLEWLRIYARVLRASGSDPDRLREIEGWVARRGGEAAGPTDG
ncbi:MAG TPA: toll/interleukin-1 receptor domain-containing protein [Longimicrobiales bacterium]|nr:toll/interleukin-1 receptor domain-containing protein [Longimicrobiales bacterium]